ncbi:MAG: PLP-dependent aminotransferase family protein [Deltaproteobacteria bacterium]|nr:PLP-dependent aminotransferase family protein [Deltaproteobacteria bacterium]MBW2393334.1 PLP-dependent aminotransferase family protein [Deltaproteobacteria bacterium]
MHELPFSPDRDASEPVYLQLADHLGRLIASGRLQPGERLPASRDLAASLGLARNTVNQAYQTLIDRDRLRARVGQGTFVMDEAPIPAEHAGRSAGGRSFVWESLFSGPARALPAHLPREPAPTAFDFRPGRVAPELLPLGELRRLFGRVLENEGAELANHLDPRGWPPLREAIARALVARGVRCEADEVVVVAGAQQALDLVARVLIDPGDAVALETPGYFGADFAFRAARAHRIPIAVDENGLVTDDLARVLGHGRLKLIYTTPAVQLPTGVVLSDERRAHLLELSAAAHVPILEDDYDGELRLDDPVRPALKTADRAEQVIYVGTFSKAIFPALRLGYVVAPAPLLDRLATAKLSSAFTTPALEQAVLAEWIRSEGFARHVRRVRQEISLRVDAGLEAIAQCMPEGTLVRRPAGGGGLWMTLPDGFDARTLVRSARKADVLALHGAGFATGDNIGTALRRNLLLAVGAVGEGDVREGIARLGACATEQGAIR